MKQWDTGDTATTSLVIDYTSNAVFGALTWDRNPVHFDDKRMKNTHFKRPIANGIHCITQIGASLVELFTTPETMVIALEQHNTFIKPIYVGTSIRAVVTIDECQPNHTYWLQCLVYDEDGEIAISCRFRVRVLDA